MRDRGLPEPLPKSFIVGRLSESRSGSQREAGKPSTPERRQAVNGEQERNRSGTTAVCSFSCFSGIKKERTKGEEDKKPGSCRTRPRWTRWTRWTVLTGAGPEKQPQEFYFITPSETNHDDNKSFHFRCCSAREKSSFTERTFKKNVDLQLLTSRQDLKIRVWTKPPHLQFNIYI